MAWTLDDAVLNMVLCLHVHAHVVRLTNTGERRLEPREIVDRVEACAMWVLAHVDLAGGAGGEQLESVAIASRILMLVCRSNRTDRPVHLTELSTLVTRHAMQPTDLSILTSLRCIACIYPCMIIGQVVEKVTATMDTLAPAMENHAAALAMAWLMAVLAAARAFSAQASMPSFCEAAMRFHLNVPGSTLAGPIRLIVARRPDVAVRWMPRGPPSPGQKCMFNLLVPDVACRLGRTLGMVDWGLLPCDLDLVVGDTRERIPTVRSMVAMASPYVRALLSGNFAGVAEVSLPDLEPDGVRALLDLIRAPRPCLHVGPSGVASSLGLTLTQAVSTLAAADYLGVDAVYQMTEAALYRCITHENVDRLCEVARSHVDRGANAHKLMFFVAVYASQNAHVVDLCGPAVTAGVNHIRSATRDLFINLSASRK